MKKFLTLFFSFSFMITLLQGCSQQKAASSQDAIQQSQNIKTLDEQVKYLVSQANTFVNSKNFEEGIKISQHILQNLDSNSSEAKTILEKAKAELKKLAEQKVAEVKSDLTNKINSLGK